MRLLCLTTVLTASVAAVNAESLVPSPESRVADERCRPTTIGNADSLFKRSVEALGLDRTAGRVRVAQSTDVASMKFQSDRMYPPYLRRTLTVASSLDWERGALRGEQSFGPQTVAFVSDGE